MHVFHRGGIVKSYDPNKFQLTPGRFVRTADKNLVVRKFEAISVPLSNEL